MSSASSGCGCCRARNFEQREEAISQELLPLVSQHNGEVPQKDYESLDYNLCYNAPYEKFVQKQETEKYIQTKIEVIKWIVTFFIGFLTAMVALFIDVSVKYLTTWKFDAVHNFIKQCMWGGCVAVSLLIMLLFNLPYVLLASLLTAYEPVAAGSGIPEIKCYLNGVKVPRVVRLRTLLSKAVGVLFSVAGGLLVGKEGPMIHSGAVIGAGVPQFQSLACSRLKFNWPFFRTDRDKRDFVSGGAAAGVAAAFGAPIGGVLFSLEEGSSFWNQKLTWRTFFCSMAATFSLNFFLSGISTGDWGYFYLPGLINFGEFKCDSSKGLCHLWNSVDLFIFIVMGFVGGLVGALFNILNLLITKFRMRHVQRRHPVFRIVDALVVALLTTLVTFLAPLALGECKAWTSNSTNITIATTVSPPSDIDSSLRSYFCPAGQYNDMATLFFNSQEDAIKELFHQGGKFSIPTLSLCFVFFFLLMCLTYGTPVPSGLFVPCLLCGATYGRLVANVLENGLGYKQIYSGTFALVGAAAFLGGVVRMTISLTVILIESTNEISYGLPIMIVLMVAKWSGDLFTEGIYDLHIELRGVPLLGWEAPPRMERICAGDIMSSKLSYIYPKCRVSSIIRLLRTTAHQAYPVVTLRERAPPSPDCASREDAEDDNDLKLPDHPTERGTTPIDGMSRNDDAHTCLHFQGIILRSQLTVLLQAGVFYSDLQSETVAQPELSYEDMTQQYPRYPNIFDLDLSHVASSAIMDVGPYMNCCPYIVSPNMPLPPVFNLFRSMGLRHLPVVTGDGELQGIITRHNLTEEHLKEHLRHCRYRYRR